MTPEEQLHASFLKDEYMKLQDFYEDYDRRSLQIKGWVSAGSVAAIAVGFNSANAGGGAIWIVVALLAAAFWYLEACWKTFQYALRDRIKTIEAHFRKPTSGLTLTPAPLQIFHAWFRAHGGDHLGLDDEHGVKSRNLVVRSIKAAVQPFVMLPYVLIILMCLWGYLHGPFGPAIGTTTLPTPAPVTTKPVR